MSVTNSLMSFTLVKISIVFDFLTVSHTNLLFSSKFHFSFYAWQSECHFILRIWQWTSVDGLIYFDNRHDILSKEKERSHSNWVWLSWSKCTKQNGEVAFSDKTLYIAVTFWSICILIFIIFWKGYVSFYSFP